MKLDWNAFVARLQVNPAYVHHFLPPGTDEQIESTEETLGNLPSTLKEMLQTFNGAELFLFPSPFLSVFRNSNRPPLPPLEWSPDWCVDAFPPRWRAAGPDRHGDWAFAMTNYGGLMILDENNAVSEWDTGQAEWLSTHVPITEWIERMIAAAELAIAELDAD
jgi:hypothetical protein